MTQIPSRWRRGDTVVLLRGEGAELVRFVWQNAHRFSLAHDVSWGGLGQGAAPKRAWSEPTASDLATSRCKEGPGVVVAYSGTELDWPDVVELGTV